jgi:hypothetical protein
VHHQAGKVRALLLVWEQRRVLRGDESLDVGVVEDALGSVVESHDYVVGDFVDPVNKTRRTSLQLPIHVRKIKK